MKYVVLYVLVCMLGTVVAQNRLTVNVSISDKVKPLPHYSWRDPEFRDSVSLNAGVRVAAVVNYDSGGADEIIAWLRPLTRALFASPASSGQSYFVANAGDDSNDGLSPDTPWRTIAKINAQLFLPGDTISFNRGDSWNAQTDSALIVSSSGMLGAPITFTSYGSGALPIIDGEFTVGNVLQTSSQNYIVIDSLQIQNSHNYLLYANNCNGCSITNNTLMNGGLYGIEVAGNSANATITGNTYGLTAGFVEIGPAIDCNTASSPGCTISKNSVDLRNVDPAQSVSGILCRNSATCIISNNTVQMTNGDQGIGLKASGAGHMTGSQVVGNSITGLQYTASCPVANGCDAEAIELTGYDANHLVMNSVISANYIQNSSGTSSDCIGIDRAGSNVISYNICIAPPTQGAIMHVSGAGTSGNLIYGNSAYGSQQGMTFLGTGVTNDVENNVMVGATIRGINFQVGATGTYDYNIAWQNGNGTGTSLNYLGGTDGGHNLSGDPQWTNSPPTSPNDMKLMSGSPAIDSGVDLGSAYEMANDPGGSTFPYAQIDQNLDGSWDRGAFAYTGISAATVTLNPTAINFHSEPTGSSSNLATVVLTNSGTATLNIASITVSGTDADQFTMTQTCGTTIAPAATCNIGVTFSPITTGSKSAAISIGDDASGSPQTVPLTGSATTPSAPSAGLVPASISFPVQNTNTSSPAQTVSLTNSGNANLNIASITITGTDAAQFSATQSCGSVLAPGAACNINMIFSPTSIGPKSAVLSITDDASGSPQAVGLSGTGAAPATSLAPASLSFGNQSVGTSSPLQTVTLTNTGTSVLNITSIALTGTDLMQFSLSQTCGSTLAAGAACNITVTFSPTTIGAESAALTITDNAMGSPQSVSLSGTGTPVPAPVVALSAVSLAFGNQATGTSSTSQSVILTNTGNAVLNITGVALTGGDAAQFGLSQTCGATLGAGSSCGINIIFSPTTTGAKSATLMITDNATGSPQSIPLSGTGTPPPAPVVVLSAASLAFSSETTGTSSAPQSVTLTNTGNAVLNITGVALTGGAAAQFGLSQTCGAILAAGSSCGINITFSPTTTGAKSAALMITDNAGGSPQSITLSGTGTAPPTPAVALAPTSLSFGNQTVSSNSGPQSVTLTNSGTAPLNFTSIAISGSAGSQFTKSQTCGITLGVGGACGITVTFLPTTAGSKSAAISLTDNAAGSPQSVPLTGTGVPTTVSLSSSSVGFGTQAIGTTSPSRVVSLTNTGNGPLAITGISIGGTNRGDFSQTNNCGSTLGAKATCSLSLMFTPTASGTRSSSAIISDNGSGGAQTISLSGNGVVQVSVSSTTLSFGNVATGSSSSAKTFTLTNNKNTALSITSFATGGSNRGDFSQTNNCGVSLASKATCTVSVIFKPTATGSRTASVSVTDNSNNSPQTVALSGSGVAPATISPASLSFGTVSHGTTTTAVNATLTNNQSSALKITAIAVGGTNHGDFSQTNTCGSSVSALGTCVISVKFKPTATGTRTASVSVTDNASNSPQSISLSGTGK